MALSLLLDIIAPILLMVGLGALVRRKFLINVETLSKVNIYLFTPAFIFDRVSRSRLEWGEMAGIVTATVLLVMALGALAWTAARVWNVGQRQLATLALVAMFYNSGNYGLPLAELAYPSGAGTRDGSAAQTFVVLTQNVLTFTLGLAIASSAQSSNLRQIAKKMLSLPVLYTLTAALVGRYFFGPDSGNEMPKVVRATTGYLANGLVPVALITLGAQLASNPRWPRWRYVSFAVIVRLATAPALMAGLLFGLHKLFPGSFLDLWPWPAELLILTAGVPTAINTLLLVLELEGDAELTADCVFWTTVVSAVSVLGWLVLLRAFF